MHIVLIIPIPSPYVCLSVFTKAMPLFSNSAVTHLITYQENSQVYGLAERMVWTLKQSLRQCLMDHS